MLSEGFSVAVRRAHGGDGDVGSAADGGECEECEGQGIPDSGRARVGIGM